MFTQVCIHYTYIQLSCKVYEIVFGCMTIFAMHIQNNFCHTRMGTLHCPHMFYFFHAHMYGLNIHMLYYSEGYVTLTWQVNGYNCTCVPFF